MDTINNIIDTAAITVGHIVSNGINLWMVFAILELLIILLLLVKPFSNPRSNDKREEIKRKVMAESDVDFANIMNSSFNAEKLYKELIVKCHPDRFAPDEEKMKIANELSTLITENKFNFKRLESLRDEAEKKLYTNC